MQPLPSGRISPLAWVDDDPWQDELMCAEAYSHSLDARRRWQRQHQHVFTAKFLPLLFCVFCIPLPLILCGLFC